MDDFESLCKVVRKCYYGSDYICDYIGKTGKSRVRNNPDGEIVDGRCKLFKEKRNERGELRAKDRWQCKV